MQKLTRWIWLMLALSCFISTLAAGAPSSIHWPAIPSEELALKEDALNPGAKALILYREVCNDDVKGIESQHYRLKILTEEGRSYGDVQIPYAPKLGSVEDIQARVVQPEGRTVEFTSQVFDKVVLKTRKYQVQVKAFTLPEVQPGSIVEYSYVTRWHVKLPDVIRHPEEHLVLGTLSLPATRWVLQDELSVRRSRFTLRPLPHAPIVWTSNVLTRDNGPVSQPDGSFVFQADNVPAFPEEEFMPPADSLKTCVDFYYYLGVLHTAQDFWASYIDGYAETLEPLWTHPKAMQRVVEQSVSAQDAPEAKLRKLYQRAQQFVYASQEHWSGGSGETAKPNKNLEEILKHDYGAGNQINLLFVALARAAGFAAAPVRVANREQRFFRPNLMDPDQLDALVAWVQIGSQAYYLDPATPYCPFGLLPWNETATRGYRIDKPGGVYLTTPAPKVSEAVIERKGSLQIDDQGTLTGTVDVVFSGQEALERRLAGQKHTDPERRQQLTDEVKSWLTAGSTVELTDLNRWEQSAEPLRARFSIRVPQYARRVGHRWLLRAAVFQIPVQPRFETARRVHPVYFRTRVSASMNSSCKRPRAHKWRACPACRLRTRSWGATSFPAAGRAGACTSRAG